MSVDSRIDLSFLYITRYTTSSNWSLEPTNALGTDPYNRPKPTEPLPIDVEQNKYKAEKILDKMVFVRGKASILILDLIV